MLELILTTLFSILAVLALIFFNALWVAAEFAIVRVRRTRIEELAGQGVEAAKHALVIIDGISEYLALTQIGITVASLAVGWFAENAAVRMLSLFFPSHNPSSGFLHAGGIAVAFLLITVLHVVLGEQVPKLLAVRSAEQYLLILARPLRIVHLVLRPFLRILERMSAWILRRLGHGAASDQPLTEDELKLIMANSHKGGVVSDVEADIIVRAFAFADKQSEEIMIPAEKVAYISLECSLEQNLETVRKHMHSRFPVCRSGLDSVIGMVSMKDVWPLLDLERSNAAFVHACRTPVFVPLDLSQEDVLKVFQKAQAHMGIVRNLDDNKTLGVVTLEDVLESLVGDVREKKHTGINYSALAANRG
jgi:CBS domain containing-hemolysin-like protein